jgi:hypothetical protein
VAFVAIMGNRSSYIGPFSIGLYAYQGMKPTFTSIDKGLWQWQEWFIATANGAFWLLTPEPQEFGPFADFDDALSMVHELVV